MTEVAIVGGGVVGTCVAYHLREAAADDELDVTLYEKSALGAETTSASMALFMWQRDGPSDADLRHRAWNEYRTLIERGTVTFERCGTLHVAETEAYLDALEGTRAGLEALGRDAEIVTPEAVEDLGLDPSAVVGGLYVPGSGYLDASEIVAHYADGAREAGVAVETGAEVTDVVVEGGAVAGVEVDGGRRDADVIVNAAGPWAVRLNELAGVSLPLRHTRGPILALEGEAPVRTPFARFERGTYARPFDESGLYVGHYATEYDDADVVDPDEPRSLEDWFHAAARETVETFIPLFADAREVDAYVGLRTVTPDGRPAVGETAVDGFLVAGGMTGQGVTLAPVVGQLVAERLENGTMPAEAEPFSPARFGGR